MTDIVIADGIGGTLLSPSTCNRWLALAQADGPIAVHDVSNIRAQPRLVDARAGGERTSMAFDSSGRVLLLAYRDRVECWDMDRGAWTHPLRLGCGVTLAEIDMIAVHPRVALVAGTVAGGGLALWDLSGGAPLRVDGPARQFDPTWTPCGNWVVSFAGEELHFWQVQANHTIRYAGASQPDAQPYCLAPGATPGSFFAGLSDGSLQLWDARSRGATAAVQAHSPGLGGVDHIAGHVVRPLLLSTSAMELSLWDTQSLTRIASVCYPVTDCGRLHAAPSDAVFAGDGVVVEESWMVMHGPTPPHVDGHAPPPDGGVPTGAVRHSKACLRLVPLSDLRSGWQFPLASLAAWARCGSSSQVVRDVNGERGP